mmetsp:Transcript_89640/g.141522  ORF Transcript_89640/g.141522 Transcript_89640/m.141522 type:complete len:207 (-) Transcript_89640:884-1504(-)
MMLGVFKFPYRINAMIAHILEKRIAILNMLSENVSDDTQIFKFYHISIASENTPFYAEYSFTIASNGFMFHEVLSQHDPNHSHSLLFCKHQIPGTLDKLLIANWRRPSSCFGFPEIVFEHPLWKFADPSRFARVKDFCWQIWNINLWKGIYQCQMRFCFSRWSAKLRDEGIIGERLLVHNVGLVADFPKKIYEFVRSGRVPRGIRG